LFKSVFTVGFHTFISRVLGFIRDVLIASYLGSTVVADAFFVAFRIPNYFRSVLAEGAFSAAFIPVFSGLVTNPKNKNDAMEFIERTMSFLVFFIIGITILFFFTMPLIISALAPGFINDVETFNLAVFFGKVVFPYLLFIALVAHFSSILNTYNKFAAGAFAPALLNISFITCLIFLSPYVLTPGHALSYGVLIGGIAQFILLYYCLYKMQITPILVLPKIDKNIKKFFNLFLPGLLGAGVIQLNIVIGTIIASFLPTGAISHIYYADRVNQLPLAVFGIALGVALLPTLSRYIKEKAKLDTIIYTQNRSIEFSLLISFPSAIGLFVLAEPIMYILFERGAFTSEDTYYSANALAFFSLGLPAYVLIKVLNPSFFAREDTKTPLYIAIVSVVINIFLSLILIKSFRESGIAIATALSSWVNVFLLYFVLKKRGQTKIDNKLQINFYKIILSSIIMLVIIIFCKRIILSELMDNNLLINASLLFSNIFIGIIVFIMMTFMLKIYTVEDIKRYFSNY
tara:strand:- start:688 stop:2235 length:1548 start_codon:yes stop_codon:yes gene_type:complete